MTLSKILNFTLPILLAGSFSYAAGHAHGSEHERRSALEVKFTRWCSHAKHPYYTR